MGVAVLIVVVVVVVVLAGALALLAGFLLRSRAEAKRMATAAAADRARRNRTVSGASSDAGQQEPTPGAPTVSVVIPALNEAESIGWVLGNIPPWVTEIVLVDGLSIDRTEVVARTLVPNLVVVHQRDRGKGAALRAGFAAAHCDIIAMIDADGSTDPRELHLFVEALVGGAEFVKGSREMKDGGSVDFTLWRRAGNLGFVKLANFLYGSRFTDLLYGYCAFWRTFLPDLELNADGFEIETQLVVNAIKAGLKIVEVPSVELERRAGSSNLHAFSDGKRVLKTMLREHPRLGNPVPGEVFEMIEIRTAAIDTPAWLPAGRDRRLGQERREFEPDEFGYGGPQRRSGVERRKELLRAVRVLVPKRGGDRRRTAPEVAGYTGPERRSGRDRRVDASVAAAAQAAEESLGLKVETDQSPGAPDTPPSQSE